MQFNTMRTHSCQNQVSVSDPFYVPELLAYDALSLIGTTVDMYKTKVRNRKFSELTVDEKAGFVRFIKNTNPACEILTTQQMTTFARQLLNMCFQSFQKRRYLATIAASASNTNFSLPTLSDSRTIVASTLHMLLEGVHASSENKVQLSICLATAWSARKPSRKEFSRYGYKAEQLNMQGKCAPILFPGTDHSTTEVYENCLPALAKMLRTQNLVMREGESPTLHVLWSTVVAGAIGASQFEELFILQSNSLDHVQTVQGPLRTRQRRLY